MSEILIEKADGSKEPFKVEKLKHSLKRAGATQGEIKDIVSKIEQTLYQGIKTEEIYKEAFSLLRSSETFSATRYSLRRALFGLGPTGFPFEDFLEKMFQHEGYQTETRVDVTGACAPHELDIVGYKDDDCFIAEAKFHARPGIKSDLQVALYTYARFLDLKGVNVPKHASCGVRSAWIITNTKFTHTAVEYAECVGLNLLSWGYPEENSLQDRIEKTGLYPVTVLQSLSNNEKRTLLENGTVLCDQLAKNKDILRSIGVSGNKADAAIEESVKLCTIE